MLYATRESRRSFLRYFQDLIEDFEECDDVELKDSLRLPDKKVRVPTPAVPLQLLLGGEDGYRMQLEAEVTLDEDGYFQRSGDFLLFDPLTFYSTISGFIRLTSGDTVMLGREDALQKLLLQYPNVVDSKHVRLKLTSNGLVLKNKSSTSGACLTPLTGNKTVERMEQWRVSNLESLVKVLGCAIEHPGRGEALDLIEQVIKVMSREAYREPTRDGEPGGLLELPAKPAPIFVGDLHARIDNLLVVLTQNNFLASLQDGSGMLILVGDAVHPDVPGREDEMELSMLLMDLIFRLKLAFPERVFYLRGNHDGFSEEISKGGVPQGLLWEKALHDRRGSRYRDAMQRLYDVLPYVAVSPKFLSCHAGPPTMKVSREDMIHVRDNPKLRHQLTHLRMSKPNSPSGYSRGDVRRMRKALGVEPDTPIVVGHTPLSVDDTCWINAGGIEHHHVLFGAHPEKIGVITRPESHLVPLIYPVEPLMAPYNRLVRTGRLRA